MGPDINFHSRDVYSMATLFLMLLFVVPVQRHEQTDILLRGATVYDGTGLPGVVRDVAIKGDRIHAIGAGLQAGPNTEVIDVNGMIIAPGFIDLHTHSDDDIVLPRTRNNLNYLTQGVTTIVTGNCGFGPVDVKEYYSKLERNKPGSNVCHLMPHNAIRRNVMGNVNRSPSNVELQRMLELMEQGMKSGAWGLSTGLIYTPGTYAQLDELCALAEIAGKHKGIYASHIRSEGSELMAAVEEALIIGQRAKLPVHISHLKSSGRTNWGNAGALLSRLQMARKQQLVTADQYPYIASSTSLQATVIPPRFREGTAKEMVARFDHPQQGTAMREAVRERIKQSDNGRDIRIARYVPKPSWQGKDLAAIAKAEGKEPLEIVIEIESQGGAQIVHFSMNEEDMRLIAKADFVATASDGSTKLPDDTVPHPRNYGTFSRKIGRYGIEERMFPLEQAVRSATGLPADVLQLKERGYLKAGYYADVVVIDPNEYRDRATFDKPHQYTTGVKYLFVNGVAAIEKSQPTGKLSGRALRMTEAR